MRSSRSLNNKRDKTEPPLLLSTKGFAFIVLQYISRSQMKNRKKWLCLDEIGLNPDDPDGL